MELECPACKAPIEVPEPQSELTAAEIVTAAADEGSEDHDTSPHQPFVRAEDRNVQCPSCNTSLESGAVICVNCGYNFKTRRKVSAAREEEVVETGGGGSSGNNVEKIKIIALVSAIGIALVFTIFRMVTG